MFMGGPSKKIGSTGNGKRSEMFMGGPCKEIGSTGNGKSLTCSWEGLLQK